MGHIIGGNDVAYIDTGCDGHLWKSSAPLVGVRPGRGVMATGITGAQLRGRFDGPGGCRFCWPLCDHVISSEHSLAGAEHTLGCIVFLRPT